MTLPPANRTFTGNALTVPNVPRAAANGNTGTLYLRLRDAADVAISTAFGGAVLSEFKVITEL